MIVSRRTIALGSMSFTLAGCFDRPYYERSASQKKFLDGLKELASPALSSGNPLQIEAAARKCVVLSTQVGDFSGWYGVLKEIRGNSENVAITLEIGPQVSLYAFNDWALALAGSLIDSLSAPYREGPPPGLSDKAIAALKTFKLGQTVTISGRMGEIAGSGLFDLTRLFGKGEADNRGFLESPRFVARVEDLAASKD
jgi:hypothetical protein